MKHKIYHHQLNVRALELELKMLQELQRSDDLTIGFEVTHALLNQNLDYNIDPQHNLNEGIDKTCVEELLSKVSDFKEIIEERDIWIFFLKTDLDSISAAAVLELYLEDESKILIPEVKNRIFNIANYDRHGRKWIPKFNNNKVNNKTIPQTNKIPRGLFMLISGWKNTLDYKISTMKEWILTGKFKDIEKYNKMAIKNFKESLSNSKIDVIIPEKLVFVRSNKRGACGIGYQFAPIVIAMNPSFRFGFGDKRIYGRKWTIAQCNDNFIPLNDVLIKTLELEPGWGGSNTTIGSPQDRPSKISKEDIISILEEVVEDSFVPPKKYKSGKKWKN